MINQNNFTLFTTIMAMTFIFIVLFGYAFIKRLVKAKEDSGGEHE